MQRAFDDVRTRLGQSTDPYIRERLSDLQDLTNRLLLRLTGRVAADPSSLPDDMIVIARDMGPAELLDYDRTRLRGLVLEEGSALSHVAIVARALDIPVVGRAPDVLSRVEPGDAIVVDGDNAQVLVRPAEDILQTVHAAIEARAERRRKYAALRDLPSATRDQARISLHMNAGLLIDMQHLDETGADGVGLYRTEIPFMVRSEFPDVDAQAWLYSRVLDLADGRPVTFRTLDVGGDKVLPYVGAFGDDNPAMGWRAIRIGLDRPAMLRRQLRALIQAANGRPLVGHVPDDRRGQRVVERSPPARSRARARASGAARPCPSVCVLALCSKCRRWPGSSTACCPMSTSFRWARTIFCSSFMPPIAATAGWPAATTACPHRSSDCYILWWRRSGRPGSISRSAARWRAVRSRRWRCSPSACARCRCRPARSVRLRP